MIRAKELDDRNSIEIQPSQLILKRGSQQIVKISRSEVRGTKNSISQSATSAAIKMPLFDGKTFEQWLVQLENERSVNAFKQGAQALGTLAVDNPGYQKRAIAVIRPLVRQHGSHYLGHDHYPWVSSFNLFFTRLPAEAVVNFAIEELKSGTAASRNYSTLLLSLGVIYEDRPELQQKHLNAIKHRFPEIFQTVIRKLESFDNDSDGIAVRRVLGSAFYTVRRQRNGFQFSVNEPVPKPIVSLIEQQIAATHASETGAFLASLLIGADSNSKFAIREFADRIGDRSLPADLRSTMPFQSSRSNPQSAI